MPRYVETDGDWVRRPPGELLDCKLVVHVAFCRRAPLDKMLDERVGSVSEGRVQLKPALSLGGLVPVFFVFADLGRVQSADRQEREGFGWFRERDFVPFVPVRDDSLVDGARVGRYGFFVPYIWVDQPAGMLMGREIYGFPKLLADISIRGTRCSAKSLVYHRGRQMAMKEIATAKKICCERPRTQLPDGDSAELLHASLASLVQLERMSLRRRGKGHPELESLRTELEAMSNCFHELGGAPLYFLKQFRSARGGGEAALQQIVRAAGSVRKWSPPKKPGLSRLSLPTLPSGAALRLPDTFRLASRVVPRLVLEGWNLEIARGEVLSSRGETATH